MLIDTQPHNWFSRERRGSFLFVRDGDGHIIATGGLYALENKPSTKERLRNRYGDGEKVCQIVRLYIKPRARRKGRGTLIVAALESQASEFDYTSSYLHADDQTPETLSFWNSQGWRVWPILLSIQPRNRDERRFRQVVALRTLTKRKIET